jgi:predicted membrane chloride channel (bestrophin family)
MYNKLMKFFKTIFLIIDYRTVIIASLSILATYFAIRYGITAEFPLTLIGIAIVFPIVFSLAEAYKRREKALDQYGSLKAHGRILFFASRDWVVDDNKEADEDIRRIMRSILENSTMYFRSDKKDDLVEKEHKVYEDFSQMSKCIRRMRERGLPSGEVSRANQFLSKMIAAFETMKHIFQYRTPRSLRLYSKLFIYLLPILYSPYFAHIAEEYASGLDYVMPVIFSVILVGLDNIQEHLENPYDLDVQDDIILNSEKYADSLV